MGNSRKEKINRKKKGSTRKGGVEIGESDLISKLPKHILYNILSRLPNKDSARTCTLSKSWRNLYASKPYMYYDFSDFCPEHPSSMHKSRIDGKKMEFMNFVGHSLMRFLQQAQPSHIEVFSLSFSYDYSLPKEDRDRIDRWLQRVIDNGVKHMFLDIKFPKKHKLPRFVFTSETLRELFVSSCSFINGVKGVNFPNLQKLWLIEESVSGNEVLTDISIKQLISGCPSLEVLGLRGFHGLINLQLSSLTKLVDLWLCICDRVRMVEIGSPKFQSFSYTNGSSSKVALLGVDETIKRLELLSTYDLGLGAAQFSTFHHLEELILYAFQSSTKWPKIEISSQSLKRLVIKYQRAEEMAQIDCPVLQSLKYEDNEMPFNSVSPLDLKDFRLEFLLYPHQYSIWLDSLKTFFGKNFCTTENLKIIIFLEQLGQVIILDGLVETMLNFPYKFIGNSEHAARIIITSRYINLKTDILTCAKLPEGKIALNLVSPCSKFTEIFFEKLSRIQESGISKYHLPGVVDKHLSLCTVKKDICGNIPAVLRQSQFSMYQVSRIMLKWGWSKHDTRCTEDMQARVWFD